MDACLTLDAFLGQTGGEFISFGGASTGTITVASVGAPGDTITVGGVVFTAVSGPRTSGAQDFSLDSAEIVGIAAELAAAMADPVNGLVAIASAMVQTPGTPVVRLTSAAGGPYSEIPIATSAPAVYELSGDTLIGGRLLLTAILDEACRQVSSACWGDRRSTAHLYLTGHYAAELAGDTGTGVTSRKIDKISESFGQQPPSAADLGRTRWGRLYLGMLRTALCIPAVVITTRFKGCC